jgi:hypothetical protein
MQDAGDRPIRRAGCDEEASSGERPRGRDGETVDGRGQKQEPSARPDTDPAQPTDKSSEMALSAWLRGRGIGPRIRLLAATMATEAAR